MSLRTHGVHNGDVERRLRHRTWSVPNDARFSAGSYPRDLLPFVVVVRTNGRGAVWHTIAQDRLVRFLLRPKNAYNTLVDRTYLFAQDAPQGRP